MANPEHLLPQDITRREFIERSTKRAAIVVFALGTGSFVKGLNDIGVYNENTVKSIPRQQVFNGVQEVNLGTGLLVFAAALKLVNRFNKTEASQEIPKA